MRTAGPRTVRRAPAAARRRAGGFTLVELLLVVALLGVMMGLGLGLFARLDLGERVVRSQVVSQLRAARNHAVARQASANVELDAKDGIVRPSGLRVVGTFQFEDPSLEGALGQLPSMIGGRQVDDGWQGRAIDFVGEPDGAHVAWPVHQDGAWNPRHGWSISLAVKYSGQDGGSLLALGESLGIGLGGDGSFSAWFAPELFDEAGETRRGGRVSLSSAPGVVPRGRWVVLEARYDRVRFELWVDGARRAHIAEDAPVWPPEGPLRLCPSQVPFRGAVDRLVVACASRDDGYQLPQGARLDPAGPSLVRFAPGGMLDRSIHQEPVRIRILKDEAPEEVVVVQMSGAVE